jgi:hypothetical protein
MRAHWHVRRLTREDSREAFRLIEEVLLRDPNNALALADLACNYNFAGVFGWIDEPPLVASEKMGDAARRAVAADDQDATAQAILGLYELFSSRHDDAIKRLKRAIELRSKLKFCARLSGRCLQFRWRARQFNRGPQ